MFNSLSLFVFACLFGPKALQYCKTDFFLPPKAPITCWGATWPGGLTDPSCPGEEERETDRKARSELPLESLHIAQA